MDSSTTGRQANHYQFGSAKNSPQLKDGTLSRNGQIDGGNDGYGLRSVSPSPPQIGSPLQTVQASQPRSEQADRMARSNSPAPMTGFVTGTSPLYLYNAYAGFPFNEAHAAPAIRG